MKIVETDKIRADIGSYGILTNAATVSVKDKETGKWAEVRVMDQNDTTEITRAISSAREQLDRDKK